MAEIISVSYNTGSTISGTIQIGDLGVEQQPQEYAAFPGGVRWWGTPDLNLGYVIAHTVPAMNQPNPLSIPAGVGFWRSKFLTEESFLSLSNVIPPRIGQTPFTGATEAKDWLNANGYWTSYSDTWKYNSVTLLNWPAGSSGYTLYNGGFTSIDDGFQNTPLTVQTFTMNGVSSTSLYVSTNGYFTLGVGSGGIYSSPQQSSNPAIVGANLGDLWLQPGLTSSDGDVQNLYYQTISNGDKYAIKLLVYCGRYGNPTNPFSYLLNFYRDSQYQWVETRAKSNVIGNAGPYNAIDVSQGASTTSRVWRGDLNGQNWVYMGTGSITE